LRLLLINSLCLILLAFNLSAQTADSVKRERKDYRPTGIRFGTDAIAFVKSRTDDTFTGAEYNVDIDFNRYYLVYDFGNWGRTLQGDQESYSNDGKYYRFGIDVNFLTKDPDRNMFFLGGRYGHSTFSEDLIIVKDDPYWGPINNTYTNRDVNGRWFELTTGIKVKMWKIFWMGYTARFKFGLKTNEPGELMPHDVPGYGRTDKESYWGFNYQLFIRIPVRKQPVIKVDKKKK
jgi:hypothetical protein